MVPILQTILFVIAFIVAVLFVVQKRKQAGITGLKSAVTPISFFLIGLVNLIAYWFNFMGLWNWTLTVLLLLLGAYFTKYLAVPKRR
ncbi:hypothetical protein [Mesobacillus maritimus]|uniref:hypothetical protein n=1 Tax=Mesobacillus maritimus TaxID=1643336 RepID=UPI00255997B4|nr:hypothetical protein [Mesobacillus maritimus]